MDPFEEFNAPQSYQNLEQIALESEFDGADSFFDNIESHTPKNGTKAKIEQFYTPAPMPTTSGVLLNYDGEQKFSCQSERVIKKAKRRSGVVQSLKATTSSGQNDAAADDLCNGISRLSTKMFEGISLNDISPNKIHSMTTRRDTALFTPVISLRTRNVNREITKRKCSPVRHKPNEMTLAEQILHFQTDTPPRFKSKMRKLEAPHETTLTRTIPKTPKLMTKDRAKHCHAHETLEQKQNMEVEDMRKYCLKPIPLNKKMLLSPNVINRLPPRPATVPEPFNLTEVKPKSPKFKETCFQFKARPAPRFVRKPVTSEQSDSQGERSINKHSIPVEPFSFYERDKNKLLEKEAKIKKFLDENKPPPFQARPMPASSLSTSRNSSIISRHKHLEEEEEVKEFRANPPTVLFKEPFVPKKAEMPLTETVEINLNTERRAKEREEFDRARKEKEAQVELLKKEWEEIRLKQEEKDIKKLRKELVHKPIPLPQYLDITKNE